MRGRYQRLTSITSSSQRPTCMEKGAATLVPYFTLSVGAVMLMRL